MRIFLLVLFSLGSLLSIAQKDSSRTRDQALDNVIDVTFEAAELRAQLNRFEDQAGIKLHYKVENETLNELGGLSKHLFKLYQSITTSNPDANKNLTGFFSSCENGQLSKKLSYRSHPSRDLAACALPDSELQAFDSTANTYFQKSPLNTPDFEEAPEYVSDFLKQSVYQYSNIYSAHANQCDSGETKNSGYNQYVGDTQFERSRDWHSKTEELAKQLQNLQDGQIPRSTLASTRTVLSEKVAHILSLNSTLSQCALDELNVQGQILYQHTGIHFYFLTADLSFLIPQDSMQLFVDQVAQKLFSSAPGEKFMVALWLRLAGNTKHPYNALLFSQNGNHVNRSDINFARYNFGSKYKASTYHLYTSIFTNIRKPLIICYQTLKANGLISTSFLRKPNPLKGLGQIYVHVFKQDAQLEQLNQIEQQLQAAQWDDLSECRSCGSIDRLALMRQRNKLLTDAILKPRLTEVKMHFKQRYLCELENARWAVWDWATKTYPYVFDKTISEALTDYLKGQRGYKEGTCDVEPDLVMDALNVSSLLLSTVNLDFIPDAITVSYCLAKRRYKEAAANSLSLLVPGSIYAAKRVLSSPGELVTAINNGARIISENGTYQALDAEQDLLLQYYGLSPADMPAIPLLLKNDLSITRQLFPLTESQALMISNVSELAEAKRLEFLKECAENAAFRKKCAEEPEHIWRWAGKITEIRGISREQFMNSVKEFSDKNMAEKCWYLFSTNQFEELEKFFVTKNINGLYPPMDGFLNVLKVLSCEALKGMAFDRYQEFEGLAGYFASPMDKNGKSYSFESRALSQKKKYPYYFKFQLLDPCNSNLIFTFGEVISWFKQSGGAVQIKSNVNFKNLIEGIHYVILEKRVL